jgi:ADP-ribose pyrophosphatase YjhB (NUDIX family)
VTAASSPPGRQVTRIASYALCIEDERILLCRIAPGPWSAVGSWTLPGGGLEFGEPPRTGALRELTEETGLEGSIIALADVLDWASHWVDPADGVEEAFHAIQVVYRVHVTGGELRDEIGGSTDVARWFTRAEAETLPLVDLARAGLSLAFENAQG